MSTHPATLPGDLYPVEHRMSTLGLLPRRIRMSTISPLPTDFRGVSA